MRAHSSSFNRNCFTCHMRSHYITYPAAQWQQENHEGKD